MAESGLDPRDLAGLSERKLRSLARLHAKLAGDDDGREWWPLAVRRLPLGDRLDLAGDARLLAHWIERERRRCRDTGYFVEAYGHVQPERQGAAPIPFEFWPEVEGAAARSVGATSQREVLDAFVREAIVVVLKARQLGLTWLALHYALWLMMLDPEMQRAKVLALSKNEGDATKLVRRVRRINRLLPAYLRGGEDAETRGALSRFKVAGGGEIQSLVSTPDAARGEQADLLLWDEAAFTRNGNFEDILTAVLSAVGKMFLVSTGNGPAEAPGDGQGFAITLGKAVAPDADPEGPAMHGVFLPDDVHPDRDEAWRRQERKKYIKPVNFAQEHPLTLDEALAGKQGTKVYPLDGIAAALRLGAELDARLAEGTLPDPAEDGLLAAATDWGTCSWLGCLWELEGGGLYVPPGEVYTQPGEMEVSERVRALHANLLLMVQGVGGRSPAPLLGEWRFDSAGVEQQGTAVSVVQEDALLQSQWQMARTTRGPRCRTLSVRFNAYKSQTMDYLEWLFRRTAQGERHGVIAVSPQNPVLARQLKGLEYMDDGTGRVKKLDDHGPDGLVAGAAPVAAANLHRMPSPGDDAVNQPEPAAA